MCLILLYVDNKTKTLKSKTYLYVIWHICCYILYNIIYTCYIILHFDEILVLQGVLFSIYSFRNRRSCHVLHVR